MAVVSQDELSYIQRNMNQYVLLAVFIKHSVDHTVMINQRHIQIQDLLKGFMVACHSTLQYLSELLTTHCHHRLSATT